MVVLSIPQRVQAVRGMSIRKEEFEVLDVAEVVRTVQRECERAHAHSRFVDFDRHRHQRVVLVADQHRMNTLAADGPQSVAGVGHGSTDA